MAGRSLRSSWYRKMLCRWQSNNSANSSPGSLVFLQVAIIFVGFTLASSPGGGLTNWRRNSKPKPRLQPVKTTTRLSMIDIELLCFQNLSGWEEAGSVVVDLARFKGRKSLQRLLLAALAVWLFILLWPCARFGDLCMTRRCADIGVSRASTICRNWQHGFEPKCRLFHELAVISGTVAFLSATSVSFLCCYCHLKAI